MHLRQYGLNDELLDPARAATNPKEVPS